MSDILLSAFNSLFRLEGDLDSHCRAIADNRNEIANLSQENMDYVRDQIKNLLACQVGMPIQPRPLQKG